MLILCLFFYSYDQGATRTIIGEEEQHNKPENGHSTSRDEEINRQCTSSQIGQSQNDQNAPNDQREINKYAPYDALLLDQEETDHLTTPFLDQDETDTIIQSVSRQLNITQP